MHGALPKDWNPRCGSVRVTHMCLVKTPFASLKWLLLMPIWCTGNPFAPLSYLSFAVPPLPDDLPTYNPSKHLRQLEDDGLDIVPVPFTVSPLGLSKLIRSRIGQSTRWENLKIDESKFKETMVCLPPLPTVLWNPQSSG